MKTESSYEISGEEFVAAQTRKIEREFKCSRPKPRNRQMGFKTGWLNNVGGAFCVTIPDAVSSPRDKG